MHLIFAYERKWGSGTENILVNVLMSGDARHTFEVFRGSGRQMRNFHAQLRKEFI